MPAFITLDGLACHAPDGRRLFENVSLAFGREKTGLVGRNGVGKTTLVRLILGELAPGAGALAVTGRVAALRQQLRPPSEARLKDLLGVAAGLDRLERIEQGGASPGDLEAADWSLPQRAAEALAQAGLAGFDLERRAETLSGGEATRAALAALLVAQPDVIVMDEPTNNLDAEGRQAVAQLLQQWRGGALVISHDRSLLRRMDRIVELTTIGVEVYGGGYDLYHARKAEAEAAAERELERATAALARTQGAIQAAHERKARRDSAGRRDRSKGDMPKLWFDAQAERATSTLGRQRRVVERLRTAASADLDAARERVARVRRLDVALPTSGLPASKCVLAFDRVSFAWPGGRPLLEDVSFQLVGPRRLALTGPNGSGKTTLIRLAIGELDPSSGAVRRNVAGALLDQRAALLDDRLTLVENFRRLNGSASEGAAHAALAQFLFRNVEALKPAGALSGGERLRAALACALMADPAPQLIILDEPTNHLDLESIAAIETALSAYDGALLVVSHDQAFLGAIGVDAELRLGAGRPD